MRAGPPLILIAFPSKSKALHTKKKANPVKILKCHAALIDAEEDVEWQTVVGYHQFS